MAGIIFSLLAIGFLLGISIAMHLNAARKSQPAYARQLTKKARRMAAGSMFSLAAGAWLLYM